MAKLVLEFSGHIPAKKNSVVLTRYGKRPSKAYERWEKAELATLRDTPAIPGPVSISYDFWIRGKESPALFDLDNIIASINDLLQKAEIISGDDWSMLPAPSPRLRGFVRGEQRTVVTIASVEAPWVPILATLRDGDAVRALAKVNGVTIKAQRAMLWDQLQGLEIAG
jgi:Holliday junction resolvase RusA-like endonuclease